jgi:hypothetical protein
MADSLYLKIISITVEGHTHKIVLPHSHVTCGWVLSQVLSQVQKEFDEESKKVVGIGMEDGSETMNYYLTLLER